MNQKKMAIVGAGNIADTHLKSLSGVDTIEVVGIASRTPEKAKVLADTFSMPCYSTYQEMIRQARPDYVLVTTPHLSHVPIAVDLMRLGVHVLIEKPLAVDARDAHRCVAVSRETNQKVGVVFQMRLKPHYLKMLDALNQGMIGRVSRVNLTATTWFRSQAYYSSQAWRATWAGEGGGILVNQAPHDLDMMIHAVGLPAAVSAYLGTHGHDIETEDDICAVMRWDNGATGTLHMRTNESPGRYLFEVVGEEGTLTLDQESLRLSRLSQNVRNFSRTTRSHLAHPACGEVVTYELADTRDRYAELHRNFAASLNEEVAMICDAEDALKEVELANALVVSAMTGRWAPVPVGQDLFGHTYRMLCEHRDIEKVRRLMAAEDHPALSLAGN